MSIFTFIFLGLAVQLLKRTQSAASTSEYLFSLIAAGIVTLVAGFALQAKKKWAVFVAQPLTLFFPFQKHDEETTESRSRE
jgi:hypothetical protein